MKTKDAIDWFDLEMERFLFMRKYYPDVADNLWKYYGQRVLFLLKVLSNFPNHKEKRKRWNHFSSHIASR